MYKSYYVVHIKVLILYVRTIVYKNNKETKLINDRYRDKSECYK